MVEVKEMKQRESDCVMEISVFRPLHKSGCYLKAEIVYFNVIVVDVLTSAAAAFKYITFILMSFFFVY